MEQAIAIAASLCRQFEGLYLRPYICPAGYPTIGYGSRWYEDGTPVTMTDRPITRERAESLLQLTLHRDYLPGILTASPVLGEYPKVLAAMLDFAYNCGVPRYRASTLRKRVEDEDWEGAKVQLLKWVHGGGKILPGLVARRVAEGRLLS